MNGEAVRLIGVIISLPVCLSLCPCRQRPDPSYEQHGEWDKVNYKTHVEEIN